MRLEWWILLAVWILTTGMLFFISKKKNSPSRNRLLIQTRHHMDLWFSGS
ncbi:hypothetical protein AA0X95_04180 [Bacillus sp. 1P10SD]